MRKSITQESDYGCGIACFAFATNMTYKEAARFLGSKQACSERFWCKDLVSELARADNDYECKYVKPHMRRKIYQEGTIVLIARSKHYAAGHYLIRHNEHWMDPWINLLYDYDIANAKSGYRKRLPGRPLYMIRPIR